VSKSDIWLVIKCILQGKVCKFVKAMSYNDYKVSCMLSRQCDCKSIYRVMYELESKVWHAIAGIIGLEWLAWH
jgi:hypothetical protein